MNSVNSQWKQPPRRNGLGKQYSKTSCFCSTSLIFTGDVDFFSFNVSGSILFKCMSLEADRMTEQQEKVLSVLEEKFPDLPPREEIISVLQETQINAQGSSKLPFIFQTCYKFICITLSEYVLVRVVKTGAVCSLQHVKCCILILN